MISAKFLWGNVLLGGKLQIGAKNSNFEIFESALYMKSVSIPLIVNNDGIFVNASVNGVNVKFLIDSGSRPTILSSRMYKKLNSKPCLYRSTGLKLADGRPLSQAGVGKSN